MSSAAEALQEADNWTTLSTDVEEVFQSQDVGAITSKLSLVLTTSALTEL
jgi:hypothetical protein